MLQRVQPVWFLSWVCSIGATIAIAISYFLAARLSLALLTEPDGVAVFWPASGIAAGILITLGRRVRSVVVIGIIAATIAANVMGDRSLWTSVFKGFCNAGEAVLTAWLIEQWFGRAFAFVGVLRVLGFLIAACIGAAASAIGGAATMTLLHTSEPFGEVWLAWFLSDGVGIVVVAPLMIGLSQLGRDLPSRGEWIEGVSVLALLSLISLVVATHPSESWVSFSPGGLVLPLLLWLTARCPPVFGIAGAFAASAAVFYGITFGIGRFGDASVPLMERVKGAEAAMMTVTVYTLILTALFGERRRGEAALKDSNTRLQLALAAEQESKSRLSDALAAGQVIAFEWDAATRKSRRSANAALTLGAAEDASKCGAQSGNFLGQIHPDDRGYFKACIRELCVANPAYALSFRFCAPDGRYLWLEETAKGEFDPGGRLLRVRGLTRNVTDRKQVEQALDERNMQLSLAGREALVGSFAYDIDTEEIQISEGYAAIHGLPEGTTHIMRSIWQAGVHREDLARVDELRTCVFREQRAEYDTEYRIVRSSGEVRWVEARCFVSYRGDGSPQRVVGVHIDVTERKQTEEKLEKSERAIRELLGALPAAIYVTDAAGHLTYCNQSAVDLWGVTPKLGRDRWCDLARFYHADGTPMALEDCPTEIALKQDRVVRGREAIIERFDGTRIPIIPFPTPLRDGIGAVVGVVNMTVDISERKKAELALTERNVQLALAGKAGLVGTYAHDINMDIMQVSEGYAAIHGLPEGTTESSRSEWKRRAHPQDLARKLAVESKAFRERRGEYSVEYRIVRHGEVRWIESRSFISYDSDGSPQRIIGVNIDITERKRTEEHQGVLIAELDHRVKNVLATVSAVAGQTLETSSSMSHFVAALDGRIRSMAATHELLSARRWRGMPMAELVRREFAAYAGSNNTKIDGPEVVLSAEAGQAMGMVFHELVTNAAKYGALSTQSGHVSVRWYRKLNGSAQLVVIWQETGGPSVETPRKSGYGTGVVRHLIPYEFGGTVDFSFAPEGVRCRLEIPFDRVSSDNRNASAPERLHNASSSSAIAG